MKGKINLKLIFNFDKMQSCTEKECRSFLIDISKFLIESLNLNDLDEENIGEYEIDWEVFKTE
jgi:hypothetical protein